MLPKFLTDTPVVRSETLIRALPNAAILISGADTVVEHNEAALSLHSRLKIGSPLSFAIRDPDVLEAVARTAVDGETRRFELVDRMPIERAFAVHVARVSDGFTLIVFDDLTDARKLERMRVDFVANASHELRTPLASLQGFVETLRGPAREDASARDQFLQIMDAQARRMSRLIDDLLSLSRIELNAHVPPKDNVDLASVIRQVVDGLKPIAAEQKASFALDVPAVPAMVRGDRDELLRVFDNLIENAIKYGGASKRIDIGLTRSGSTWLASVRDYGPGIAPEHVPRLTERFYRVDIAASRDAGGTGLGLAIVKHILNRHQGQLQIESRLGEGALFAVRLGAVE